MADNMDLNPLFDQGSSSSSDDGDAAAAGPVAPIPAAFLQMVSIRSHVPVILDIADPNHAEWRCLFDSVIGKFGLADHVAAPPHPCSTSRRPVDDD